MRGRRRLPVGAYDASTGQWADGAAASPRHRDELTVATFNVWFNDSFAEQRYRAICDLLSRDMPDVMVFQEVTPRALAVFLAQPWIRARYVRAEVTRDGLDYGMLLLSRLPIDRVTFTRLPTRLSRGFLTATFTIDGAEFVVVSVHLDSGKAAAGLRDRQLRQIFRTLRPVRNAVVLGDFNMRDAENHRIVPPFRDLWPILRPAEDGFTEDTSINLMRYDMKDKHRHVRFDRVLLKGSGWTPVEIELLGTEPISSDLPRIFPSDHFGVWCRLVRGRAAAIDVRRPLWPRLRRHVR